MNLSGKPQVMVVDDDLSMCNFLRSFLAERGYQAVTLGSAEEAVKRYHAERPAAVILDVVMPGDMDGLAALAAFKKIDRDVPVIVLSGQGRTTTVVQAMKLGASDSGSKPVDETDLEVPLTNALRQHQLSREVASLREQLQSQSKYKMLFGQSERMAEVQDLIERVADTDVTVLIRGESGTGKELVARALYASSLRRDKPFVKVNCAALPTELLESELFGFERGAFTGAIQHKPGKFEFANHGTMFLDEIGDMSVALQAKLLQVLQDGEFSRLGGKHDVHVDVRVIAATNKELELAVAEALFRQDLFFRLNVHPIHMPPLRGPHAVAASGAGSAAVAAAPAGPMTPAAIAAAAAEAGNYSLKDISRTAAREAERELIFKMLQQTRWNRKETAEILGISYKALLYKIKENGLDKAS